MKNKESLEFKIKQLIVDTLKLQIDPVEIGDDEILFDGSLGVDSIATLEIIFAVEKEFGINVSDEDLRVDLFVNVKTLADYIKRKKISD